MGITTAESDLFKNKDWLYNKYVSKGYKLSYIAKLCRCHPTTVSRWVKKFGFPSRQREMVANGMWGKKREENPAWKGGRYSKQGYIYIYSPGHPNRNSNGYIAEHRLVMEHYLDRMLLKNEHVHHLNGVRDDNRIENLFIMDNDSHTKTHADIKRELCVALDENEALRSVILKSLYCMN